MNTVYGLRYIILSPLITFAVTLSGAHAKDVAGLSAAMLNTRKKIDDAATQQVVKIHAEVHPHIEKAKIVAGGDQILHVDGRSLRLLNEHRKGGGPIGLGRLLRDWWQSSAAYIFASFS